MTELDWQPLTGALAATLEAFAETPRHLFVPSFLEQRNGGERVVDGTDASLRSHRLAVKWINHPSALADCEYKPRQLSVAQRIGLQIPATIVTNAPDEVRRFAVEHGNIIVKSLAEPIIAEAGSQTAIWTRRVTAAELVDLSGVELTMHLFQEWIPKAYEIRLTVVGKRDFAVAIYAHSAATRIDWRTDYDSLSYDVIECPTEITESAHAFLSTAGLNYGAFDFIVTADTKDHIFLECNGAGQWGWLAEECGLPIAEAIADELTGNDR